MQGQPWGRIWSRLGRVFGDQQLRLSVLALAVGAVAGFGGVMLRELIDLLQHGFLGFSSENLASIVASLPAWRVVLAPTVGGLVVGLLVKFVLRDQRPHGVAEVIEASAIHGGRMTLADGMLSALISAVSIGSGASVGREGPAIHLGGVLASTLGRLCKLDRSQTRIMLGAGAAAAIAASFNAPFAGVFFAHELIIGHIALPAFAPVAIASVTGTVVARLYFGDSPAFLIAGHEISSYLEMPAFALLGVAAAIIAVAFIRLVPLVQALHVRLRTPRWASPAVGGLLIGVLALWFPEILGVGYEAVDRALDGEYLLAMLVTLVAVKLLATAICLGSGFGGGVFSPSLFIGAMLGGAFGYIVETLFPDATSSLGTYTIIGMGAVAAAIFGAPISTTFMVLELTGDYGLSIALLIAVVAAMIFVRLLHGPSFVLTMLVRRGVNVDGGHDIGSLQTVCAGDLMREDQLVMQGHEGLPALRTHLLEAPHGQVFIQIDEAYVGRLVLSDLGDLAFDASRDEGRTVAELIQANGLFVYRADALDRAVEMFSSTEDSLLAVLDNASDLRLVGCLHEIDVMRAESTYAQTLERLRAEEH
jgi:CIC family chloride channel protein